MLAAHFGHRAACEILLKAGANPSATDNLGRNALHIAAAADKAEVVALLAANKQLLEVKDTSGAYPSYAGSDQLGHERVCEIFLKVGANASATWTILPGNALHLCCRSRSRQRSLRSSQVINNSSR